MGMINFFENAYAICPSIWKSITLQELSCVWCFPDVWKKCKIVPVHKKGDKQLIKNYRPVSLLVLCGKLFEKLMVNSIFNFIDTRNILSVYQSGFHLGDSCVHQLVAIVHDINNAFDGNLSLAVRVVFLDISWFGMGVYYIKLNAWVKIKIFLN